MKTFFVRSTGKALILSFAVIWGCTVGTPRTENDSPVKVILKTLSESNEVSKLDYVGIIEEKTSTALSFSSIGTIAKIYVNEGDYVHPGQLLAKLDSTSALSMLDAAEASLKQAEDGYTRLKSVHDKGSLTEVQMVDIETKLQQAKSSFNIAKKNLRNCSLYAPAYGVVGKKMAEPGEYSIVGKSILSILDISSVKVRFSVPENEISTIPLNCKSTITVSALGNKQFVAGKIEKSVSANPVSHTYPVHVTLTNPQKALLPGMVCKVELLPEARSTCIVIPIGVIQMTADGRKYVWCEKGGKALRTFVNTGAARGNGVEITGGLAAGDRIVTEGYQKLSEGEKITGK